MPEAREREHSMTDDNAAVNDSVQPLVAAVEKGLGASDGDVDAHEIEMALRGAAWSYAIYQPPPPDIETDSDDDDVLF